MFRKILIANRGEIALRLVRAVRDLGAVSVAVYRAGRCPGAACASRRRSVGAGRHRPAAYLDAARIIALAKANSCDAIHPGYGFLSERADFAQACVQAGIAFIGPTAEQLALFGDKARARALAEECGVPLMPGSPGAGDPGAKLKTSSQRAGRGMGVMIKAIGGGGGRGMRAVLEASDLPEAYARCISEAHAFGVDGVYVERLMPHARHVEMQVLGDGVHAMSLGDRECSLQRRFQKLVEIAPSPTLTDSLRGELTQAALKMARAVN